MSRIHRVLKFGGSSVGSVEGLRNILSILSEPTSDVRWVILSACRGVTDLLYELAQSSAFGSENHCQHLFEQLEQIHLQLIGGIVSSQDRPTIWQALQPWFDQLRQLSQGIRYLQELTDRQTAAFLAFGELLSSQLLYHLLRLQTQDVYWLDARHCIQTTADRWIGAVVQWATTQQAIQQIAQYVRRYSLIITQGYIARNPAGQTTVLSRGGSDYSAALFGAALKARIIEIWTDVDGILTADPQYVATAQTIPELPFDRMRLMAQFGAKVLHPDALEPAARAEIPISIRNTFNPTAAGTMVRNSSQTDLPAKILALVWQPVDIAFHSRTATERSWLAQQYPNFMLTINPITADMAPTAEIIACIASRLSPALVATLWKTIDDTPLEFAQYSTEQAVCVLGTQPGQGQQLLRRLHHLCVLTEQQSVQSP